ncbi:MAG: hypothetical protein D6784_07620 [Chloroflexi bacterium]|nr:MAG: hypothetical protein D6784_07620 [Chloroflexota bacterium]
MKEYNYNFYAYLGAVLTLATVLVFGLFSALQPGKMVATAKALEAEAIKRGAEVYARDCATCHGDRGEGVRNSGPALNTKEFLTAAPDELIFNTITDGRPGTSMPAWGQARGGPYNAQVIEDLVAYIRSWEPTAPSLEEMVYEGDPVAGAVLFSTTCYACHGVSGEGTGAGKPLNDPELLARYDDGYFRDVIARGRPDRGMPTWGSVLSPNQIEDLVAFIRSWEKETPPPMAELGGDVRRGEDIFNATCVICHGPAGSGTEVAPRLAEDPILNDRQAVYTTISEGRLEDGMPSWGKVLSPAEINDLIAYLDTLKAGASTEQPAPSSEATAAVPPKAEFMFIQHCATCHGLKGEGREDAPALVNNEFIQTNDDQALLSLILNGRPNTAMEGFAGELTEDDIRQIIPLLRSWQ